MNGSTKNLWRHRRASLSRRGGRWTMRITARTHTFMRRQRKRVECITRRASRRHIVFRPLWQPTPLPRGEKTRFYRGTLKSFRLKTDAVRISINRRPFTTAPVRPRERKPTQFKRIVTLKSPHGHMECGPRMPRARLVFWSATRENRKRALSLRALEYYCQSPLNDRQMRGSRFILLKV